MLLCLNSARLNKAWITPIHRGLLINDILPRMAGAIYLTLIDMRVGCHNSKVGVKLSYLTTF